MLNTVVCQLSPVRLQLYVHFNVLGFLSSFAFSLCQWLFLLWLFFALPSHRTFGDFKLLTFNTHTQNWDTACDHDHYNISDGDGHDNETNGNDVEDVGVDV